MARSTGSTGAAGATARLVAGGLLGAAVLALAGCGADRGGSVALGDAPAPAITTPSNSGVVFVPLDSPSSGPSTPSSGTSTPVGVGRTAGGSTGGSAGGGAGGAGARTGGGTGSTGGGGPVRPPSGTGGTRGGTTGGGTTGTPGGSAGGTAGGGTGGTTPSPPPGGATGGGTGESTGGAAGGGGTPQTPAALAVTALRTEVTAQRWCQTVTLTLANSGDRAATSGTVTFATHVIGALGIDWWTYRTSQALAAPVAGHASADESWTVCLDAWRVPAGMHLETRAATLG